MLCSPVIEMLFQSTISIAVESKLLGQILPKIHNVPPKNRITTLMQKIEREKKKHIKVHVNGKHEILCVEKSILHIFDCIPIAIKIKFGERESGNDENCICMNNYTHEPGQDNFGRLPTCTFYTHLSFLLHVYWLLHILYSFYPFGLFLLLFYFGAGSPFKRSYTVNEVPHVRFA